MLHLFNNIKKKDILDSVLKALETNEQEEISVAISKLMKFAIEEGLTGNIWRKYILYVLINNDNAYTRSIERGLEAIGGNDIVMDDLAYFHELYYMDIKFLSPIMDFKFQRKNYNTYLKELIDEIIDVIGANTSLKAFEYAINLFYQEHGLADMAIYKAFRVDDGKLIPIKNLLDVTFNDLIGYQTQKKMLIENTEYFLNGKPYNNVLLYGDSGTGKSTSIKALLNTYFDKGLRVIEVYKHQMQEISKIINSLKVRPYFYIIYMDDLSFEEDEIEYKYLKSIIEGGIEPKPNNVAIYATSNRRHLIKETVSDNGDVMDDLHRNETQAEKLSLAYRFGLQIYYGSLSPKEFKVMVKALASKHNIVITEETLLKEASKWELTYGSLSGRCAAQFISYLSNKYLR
ncbi:MAG: ATP-binding protein [Acholeplasmatales bacterium]|nr:ATP-binding protein [Acholeplasmatales bacterium]